MAKIMVVDDEYAFADYAKLILEGMGHQVLLCLESAKGFDTAVRFKPDIIITDLNMPELDGLALIKRLKESPETKAIPILLASASTGKEDRVEALRMGAVYSIVKPLQKDALKLVIDKLVPPKAP